MTELAIVSFARAAREYCAWAESSAAQSPEDEVAKALHLLTAVYAAALHLPGGRPPSQEIESNSHAEWRRIYDRFTDLPVTNYWEIFNPLDAECEEPVLASLADDLADIHRDLQRGLVFFDASDMDAAAWEWSLHLRAHWGHHLTAALYALHAWWADSFFEGLSR